VAADPAIQSRLGFNYEILPMPQALVAVAQGASDQLHGVDDLRTERD